MDDGRGGGNNVDDKFTESFTTSGSSSCRQKLSTVLSSDRPTSTSPIATDEEVNFFLPSNSNMQSACCSPGYAYDRDLPGGDTSPYMDMYSPWNQPSTNVNSPWSREMVLYPSACRPRGYGLVGTMIREEGHVYSLAAAGGLLYTGSDSKNIRVWKDMKEFSCIKSNRLVKTIVVAREKVYSGHQDGKIRVWKASSKNSGKHRRVGALPTLKEMLRSSMNLINYVEVQRHRSSVRLRHVDAVSCLAVDEEEGLMYSGSWDKTVKVWRLADSKFMESIAAHDDAINTVAAAGFYSLVLTGSADGTLKVWRRESTSRRSTRHALQEVLLQQGPAVNGLAVSTEERVVYGGSSDGSVQVWKQKKRRMVHVGALHVHKLAVLCVAAAGRLVFSGGADKTICVWRREAAGGGHSWLALLGGHGGPVKCLVVEEEEEDESRGWVVYSGSLDRSVKVWRVGEEAVAPPVEFFPEVVAGGGTRGVGAICGGGSPNGLTCCDLD